MQAVAYLEDNYFQEDNLQEIMCVPPNFGIK